MTGTFAPWLSAHHLSLHRSVVRHRPSPAPASPRLGAHERVLVREAAEDGTQCVGTDRAIYWRTQEADCQWSRASWSSIDRVGWQRATKTLTLMASPASIALKFAGHPRLPGFAAERVCAVHVMRRQVQLSESCAITFDAARDPESGGVAWTVAYGPGCDTDDPAVVGAMDEAMHEMRSQAGC